jgi:hypothetical protein
VYDRIRRAAGQLDCCSGDEHGYRY